MIRRSVWIGLPAGPHPTRLRLAHTLQVRQRAERLDLAVTSAAA